MTDIEVARNTLAAAQAVGDTRLATEMVGFLTAEQVAERRAQRTPYQIDHREAQRVIDEIGRCALGESSE